MSVLNFDTHEAVKALSGAGVDNKQAEAIVKTVHSAINQSVGDQVATKSDIASLIAAIDSLELRMTLKLGAAVAATVGLLAAVTRLI